MAKPIRNATRLTDEQKAEYVKNGGVNCPSCHDHSIHPDILQIDASKAWGNCHCDQCGLRWVDVYKLVAVDNVEEGVGIDNVEEGVDEH